ncbi:uncharacterized protein SCODWIG_02514 [Saccharomycodes ludwigii]|uniref:Elongin-A n=1 Tax=Saccharomycodes ludwigii TaxID=36035 RepID=A0A376B7U5_9ASCO|nr:hypothetical protein SCDLUD_003033 [Saccharomycodes ludwigii]KAH3901536.1 hypothetical protein SCDLUD_003033 [Saccharomycodes ludwigii]SSD60753.1 uncharacterized protein SCODWIG_02514 [Saccharomycodes ludwigii]
MRDIPSLSLLAQIKLQQNIILLKDIGQVPYHIIRPILFKITDYKQLDLLESSNPLIIIDDDEVWYALIKKDFPNHALENYSMHKDKILSSLLKTVFKCKDKDLRDWVINNQIIQAKYNSYNFEALHSNSNTTTSQPIIERYKIPSKLLYMKYRQDINKREQEAELKLKKTINDLQKSRQENSIIHLKNDEDIKQHLPKTSSRVFKYRGDQQQNNTKSKLFLKSLNECRQYKRKFTKNSLNSLTGTSTIKQLSTKNMGVNTNNNPLINNKKDQSASPIVVVGGGGGDDKKTNTIGKKTSTTSGRIRQSLSMTKNNSIGKSTSMTPSFSTPSTNTLFIPSRETKKKKLTSIFQKNKKPNVGSDNSYLITAANPTVRNKASVYIYNNNDRSTINKKKTDGNS